MNYCQLWGAPWSNLASPSAQAAGTKVKFNNDTQSVTIINHIMQAALPCTNVGNSQALCTHTKPEGIYIQHHVYDKVRGVTCW